MVSMPGKLVREILLLQHETDLSDGNLLDAVGEIANTLAGNARKALGSDSADFGAGEDAGHTGHESPGARPSLRHHAALEPLFGHGVRGHGPQELNPPGAPRRVCARIVCGAPKESGTSSSNCAARVRFQCPKVAPFLH
jgi:hypothetical protein